MRTGTGDKVDIQEEDADDREIDDSDSQVSLSSLTHENETTVNMKNGYPDRFGAVRTITTPMHGLQPSREFMTIAHSDMQSGTTRVTRTGTTLGELEAEFEAPSRQRGTTRVSTSTKLPGTNKVTPTLLTPLVDNRAPLE